MPSTNRRTRLVTPALATAAVVAVLTICGCAHSAGHTPSNRGAGDTLMIVFENAGGPVGTIDRVELLAAYGKSQHISEGMDTLRAKLADAKEAGDTELAAKIEAEGPTWQEVLHNQLAGTEPLYTVVLDIQDELREVAEAKGLSRIIEAGDSTKGIDITQDVAAAIESSRE